MVASQRSRMFYPRNPPSRNGGKRNCLAKEGEEAFKGLVFVLNDERSLSQWLRTLLNRTRYVKGVVQKLTGSCPGTAHAYKHSTAKDEEVPCEAAVENALRKLGMEI